MGDRVSISFKNGKEESVALFNHWGGREFALQALEYAKVLRDERKGGFQPLDRLEPCTVIIDFIRFITDGMKRVEHNLYLGKDSQDGDNSDNGHFTIDLTSSTMEQDAYAWVGWTPEQIKRLKSLGKKG